MPIDKQDSPSPEQPASRGCVVTRHDGIFVDPAAPRADLLSVLDTLFGDNFLSGIDYPRFLKAVFGYGPALAPGDAPVRVAAEVAPFDPLRRALYKAVKISDGYAEYFMEPVFIGNPAEPGSELPAQLHFDEFVADMWSKGIRFGIDAAAVQAAIAAGKSDRVVVARRVDPVPGIDAQVLEMTGDLHRSDAPRRLKNGKLDLMSFENRFPQVKAGVRLLKKVPRRDGQSGFEMNGNALEPPIPADLDMQALSGPGTQVEVTGDGEFLISTMDGFLNFDKSTGQLSIDEKIVSHEGVSSRTTGNLQLSGDYEDFGEVQEKRLVEGDSITIHADVFGNIVSRGGTVLLNRNLVGGSATNAMGDIHVKGVASAAVVQAVNGTVHMARAENCVISGTRVVIEQAANCEIIADEVQLGQAEGCAVAARSVNIESAGPRRQSEMLVYALVPDDSKLDETIAATRERAETAAGLVAERKAAMERLTDEPEVRRYMLLASKIRKKEVTLTPEQVPQFQKMALAVGPALKEIGKVSLDVKAAQAEAQAALDLVASLIEQKHNAACGPSTVTIGKLTGDAVVRTMRFNPDGSSLYHFAARDIKQRLRGGLALGELIHAGDHGAVEWARSCPEPEMQSA